MHEKKLNKKYAAVYTAVFLILGLAVFLPFISGGKSLVGNGDGQSQYILQLRYMGQWLRQTVRDFSHGDFALRSYDFTIGMGEDICSIVRFHPLDFLSAFVPSAYTEGLYDFLTMFRLYLAGLSFSLFVFHWEKDGWSTLAGSIVYLFCGYTFELGIVHPIYVSPMIVMPLLLLGAEYMMEARHSFVLLTVMVWLGFTSNYYFMYINSVALLIYVLVRFFMIYHSDRVKNFFRLLFQMAEAYIIGLMLSAVTLFPTLSRYFNSYRSQSLASSGNLIVFDDKRRYFAWFINLISPLEASGNGTHLNFAVIVLPCIVILVLSGKNEWKGLKRLLLINLIFLLLPLGGYIMAVMHTENNRWVYLISLTVAVTVAFTADRAGRLSTLQKRGAIGVTVIFDAGVILLTALYGTDIYHILAAAELTVTTALLLLVNRMCDRRMKECGFPRGKSEKPEGSGRYLIGPAGNFVRKHEGSTDSERNTRTGRDTMAASCRDKAMALMLCITVASTLLNGYFTFGKQFGNLTKYYADAGTTASFFSDSKYANYNEVGSGIGGEDDNSPREWKDGFYRVDGYWKNSSEDNASIQLGYPGVQIYNSVLNASQITYLLDTENIGLTTMLHIHSLDGRTGAEAIAGVKYFQTPKKYAKQLPYGYNVIDWSDKTMAIYENEYPVNFGFTTDTVISESDYESLSAAAKEEIMLSAAVVDDKTAQTIAGRSAEESSEKSIRLTDGSAETAGIETAVLTMPESSDGMERTEDGYRVTKKKSALSFTYTRQAGCDMLVELRGLVPDGVGTSLTVRTEGISKKVTLLSEKQTYTLLRDNYLVSLGYADEDSEETLTLTFRDKGTYSLDSVSIVSVPRSDYADKIESLNSDSLRNTKFGKNIVTGTVTLDSPKYIVFQIPYSSGWSLTVNGEDADLIQTDECYMGAFLGSGTSNIRLTYKTPGAAAGRLTSLMGLMLLICGILLRQKRHGQTDNAAGNFRRAAGG